MADDELFRLLLVIVTVLLLIPFVLMLFMLPVMGWMGGWAAAGDGIRSLPFTVTVLWGVVLVGVAGVLYMLYSAISRESRDRAIEEARLAYARGEISRDEFQERVELLEREE